MGMGMDVVIWGFICYGIGIFIGWVIWGWDKTKDPAKEALKQQRREELYR